MALAGWGAAAVLAFAPARAGARRSAAVAVAGLSVAVGCLGAALIRGDWSLTYVADYASRDTPWWYRLSALWAGMAGSLLVWTWLFGLWGVVAVGVARRRAAAADVTGRAVVAVLALLGLVLTALLVWVTPPFARLEIPAIDGAGLTPVLRHPAMLYHPLLLYLGQVGLVVPFAVCLVARARRLPVATWLGLARRLMLVPLALLAVAMVAGAHWAYVELGWGGYWAWDPVENTALLPWLAGLAFLHVARRPAPAGASGGAAPARLAATTFVLALGGAFLTRSGSTGSVHAFAEAATVGRVLALTLAAAVVAVVAVEWRAERGAPPAAPVLSREGALTAAAALLMGVVLVVGFGTALALVRDGDVLVSGRYFATVTWPFALALLALAGVGPRLGWGRTPRADMARLLLPALTGVPAALMAWGALAAPTPLAVTAAGLGGATVGLTVAEFVRRRGTGAGAGEGALVAHLGLAVLLTGVTATATGTEQSGVLGPGRDLRVRGYTLVLEQLAPADADGPGAAVRATVAVFQDGRRIATVRPLAMLSGAGQRVSVSGLRSRPWEDLQVTLRAVPPGGREAVVDARVVPMAQGVWWGGLVVAAGLALAGRGGRPFDRDAPGYDSRHTRQGDDDGRAHAADSGPQPRTGSVRQVQGRS